jgi:hypothetical protein
MKKLFMSFIVLFTTVILMSACGGNETKNATENSTKNDTEEVVADSTVSTTKEVADTTEKK